MCHLKYIPLVVSYIDINSFILCITSTRLYYKEQKITILNEIYVFLYNFYYSFYYFYKWDGELIK